MKISSHRSLRAAPCSLASSATRSPVALLAIAGLAACGALDDGVDVGVDTTTAVSEPLVYEPGAVTTAPDDTTLASPRARLPLFAGTVLDEDGTPIRGASVLVNTTRTTTDEYGAWAVRIVDARRVVVSIDVAGRLPWSTVLERGTVGIEARLLSPSRVTIAAPRAGFTATDPRSGARIVVPADALVNARGGRPPGAVHVEMYSYDLGNPQAPSLPGDAILRRASGALRPMEAIAGMYVRIVDDVGMRYDLASGKTAHLTAPVPEGQRTAARTPGVSVGAGSYDASTGYYLPASSIESIVSMQDDGLAMSVSANVYKLADYWCVHLNPPDEDPTCRSLRIDIRTTVLPSRVALYRWSGDGMVFVRNLDFRDAEKHAVYGLRRNASYELWVYDITGATLVQKLAISTGPHGPAEPHPPVDDCAASVIRTWHPEWPEFLSMPTTIGTDADAAAYYAAIDPTNARDTLAKFKSVNGFTAADPGISANFYNKNELALGRALTCRSPGGTKIACTLVKYGHPGDAAAVALQHLHDGTEPGDTVAMEYTPLPAGGENVVKFYVFGSNGLRKKKTAFDEQGEKYVPNVCTGCHGGTAGSPPSGNVGAAFVPIDPSTHVYSSLVPRAPQEESIRKINALIKKQTTSQSTSIVSYINSMYPAGVDNVGSVATTFVPASWSGHASVYTNIVKPYCQLCHLSRGAKDWTVRGNLVAYNSLLPLYACPTDDAYQSTTPMPHTFAAFRNLWQGEDRGREVLDDLVDDVGADNCPVEPDGWSEEDECTGKFSHCHADECSVCHYFWVNGSCHSTC